MGAVFTNSRQTYKHIQGKGRLWIKNLSWQLEHIVPHPMMYGEGTGRIDVGKDSSEWLTMPDNLSKPIVIPAIKIKRRFDRKRKSMQERTFYITKTPKAFLREYESVKRPRL